MGDNGTVGNNKGMWATVEDCGRLWVIVGDCGDCGGLWVIVGGCGDCGLWGAVGNCGELKSLPETQSVECADPVPKSASKTTANKKKTKIKIHSQKNQIHLKFTCSLFVA